MIITRSNFNFNLILFLYYKIAKAYQSATEKEKQCLSSIESPYFNGKNKIDFKLK